MTRLAGFALAAALIPVASLAAKEWPQNFEVLPDDRSEATVKAKTDLNASLAAVTPPKKGQKKLKTQDGRYILCGDLFRNGKAYALVEINGTPSGDGSTGMPIGVGFAAWNGKQWEARGLWKINPIWRLERWKKTGDDNFPIAPAIRPFWMLEVTKNEPPLAVVVGGIWKYWQEHYIARLDPKANTLEFIEETKRAEPVDGYLRLYFDSGHRATFKAWQFNVWTGQQLLPAAYWKDGLDQSEEHQIYIATTYDNVGRTSAVYRIENNENAEDAYSYEITRNDQPYAKVRIERPNAPGTSDESEEAYFFEKLTGLPRKLYPKGWERAKPKRPEEIATITVTGEEDAIRRLASPKKK